MLAFVNLGMYNGNGIATNVFILLQHSEVVR